MNALSLLLAASILLSGVGIRRDKADTEEEYRAETVTVSASAAAEPRETEKTVSPEVAAFYVRNAQVWEEKAERAWMAGRLVVPSEGINVALFLDGGTDKVAERRQELCDAPDSAALYSDGLGFVIADHNNQSFAVLPGVQVGDKAYLLAGDSILTLTCALACDGINTGNGVTDTEGNWVSAYHDFLCYTCGEDWTHVKIAAFDITDEDHFDVEKFPEELKYLEN